MEQLSPTHIKCVQLVGRGFSSKEIAQAVGLSHRTVDQYVHEAARALGASNRREAARLLDKIEQTDRLKKLQLKSAGVVDPPESNDPEVVSKPPSKFGLPPTGGATNDLTETEKVTAIGKIALFIVVATLAMVIFVRGAFIVLS